MMTKSASEPNVTDLIQRVRELDRAATPGEWRSSQPFELGIVGQDKPEQIPALVRVSGHTEDGRRTTSFIAQVNHPEDGPFIAESRTLLVQLADACERMQAAQRFCPCQIADAPCHPRCTCVMPVSSSGCLCCARYGSEEQRKAMANMLVAQSARVAELEGQIKELRDVIEDMVYQFGYSGVKDGQPTLGSGGLSALDGAFDALGWSNPYIIPNPVWCDAPVEPRCPHQTTCGTPTPDGYKRFCDEHFHLWQEAVRTAAPSRPSTETQT